MKELKELKKGLAEEKARLRERIWREMEAKEIARFPLPVKGRIPNFVGAEEAALKAAELEEWNKAKIIVANPDSAQRPLRELALKQGKLLVMASPRLKAGYWLLEPAKVKGREAAASTIKGAAKFKKELKAEEIPKPDLILTGCVAVEPKEGKRVGKGGGYADVEILTMSKLFGKAPVITTVHDMQVVESVPFDEECDTKVDVIVTPTKVLRVKSRVKSN